MNKIILGTILFITVSCNNESSVVKLGPKYPNAKLYINYNDSNAIKIISSGSGTLGNEKIKTLVTSISVKIKNENLKSAGINLELIWENSKDGVDCYKVRQISGIDGINLEDQYYFNGSRLNIKNEILFSVYIE